MSSHKYILPPPDSSKAGLGMMIFWAVIVLGLLGSVIWWLSRDDTERVQIRNNAADMINDKLGNTPLAGIGDILRRSSPQLPPEVINPPTEEGTLSGRHVEGTVGAPMDFGTDGKAAQTPQIVLDNSAAHMQPNGASSPQFSNVPLEPVKVDSTLSPDYVADFAQWLAVRYQPAQNGLDFNVQTLNNLFGVTLAQRIKGGRSSLLRYAFQPSMLQGLYNLYINRFMEDLNTAAKKRGFTTSQNRDFHLALAGKAIMLATALESLVAIPDLKSRLQKIDKLSQQEVDLNTQLATAMQELNELRSQKASPQQIGSAQMRADGITAKFRRAEEEHQQTQRKLVDAIRKHIGQSLDDASLLFLASWVERRKAGETDALEALKSCANILRDLAKRCAEAEKITTP